MSIQKFWIIKILDKKNNNNNNVFGIIIFFILYACSCIKIENKKQGKMGDILDI